jgi:hypothetical protein
VGAWSDVSTIKKNRKSTGLHHHIPMVPFRSSEKDDDGVSNGAKPLDLLAVFDKN